ncbi:MAG: ion transporter [Muribaculaceae bacterium]|nr:ion transporter [Muribaculaceae bacterium]
MSFSLNRFKEELARALDDNLHTRQWHNIVDWLIIAMILISTTEIFLSTFDVAPGLRVVLRWIDIITLIFFTVEVCMRLWVAPLINPKWSGWKGRLRYCFSFYGFIDVISTFPFYLQWIFPLPVMAFKALRTARVVRTLRIGRYTKSFNLLSDAIREKRHELIVAMQFLIVITVILSLILFFAEHDAQPDVYDNGAVSVMWAFAQYIGDPGQFADTPPITLVGRIIACIVGLLGIAIVAVPTGIIGAGFTDAIENRNHKEEVESDAAKLRSGFERKLDRPTGMQVVPPFASVEDLKARLGMKADSLQEAVNHGPGFRVVNLATTIPTDGNNYVSDRIAVEHYPQNRSYGCYVDRQSRITIVSPSNMIDPGLTTFCFYLAYFGGFNYISREIGERAPYKSFYAFKSEEDVEHLKEYNDDLTKLMDRQGAWSLTIVVASGANEPSYPTNIHLNIGGVKGDERMSGDDLFIKDGATYETFYREFEKKVGDDLNLTVDHQKYHNNNSANLFLRKLKFNDDSNHIVMRIEWKQILWSQKRLVLARDIAECLCSAILKQPLPETPSELKTKSIGYDGYLGLD